MSIFDQAFVRLIGNEGGYVNNPSDPGGETNYGISKKAYPDLDIKNLTLDQVKAIYKRDYWDKIHADDLPPSLAIVMFDAAVNSGPSNATRWLQQALGVMSDGVFGPITLGAAKRATPQTVIDYQAARLRFMTSLPTWNKFQGGWSKRLFSVFGDALELSGA